MSDYAWIAWVVLGLILVIAEIFTPGFVLLWFGIGAIAAGLAGVVGLGYPIQFLVFFVVSTALTAASRTIFANYFVREKEGGGLKTGMESLPGKIGTVITSSRGAMNEGAVKVFGSTWTAYPLEGEPPLEAGDRVVVESIVGASIYVRRFDDTRGWRGRELTDGDEEKRS
jgi:membrane protein implicated in regulation of membrane protease activity